MLSGVVSFGSRKTPPRTGTFPTDRPDTALSLVQDTRAKKPSPHTPQVLPASTPSSAVRLELRDEAFAGRLSLTGSRQVKSRPCVRCVRRVRGGGQGRAGQGGGSGLPGDGKRGGGGGKRQLETNRFATKRENNGSHGPAGGACVPPPPRKTPPYKQAVCRPGLEQRRRILPHSFSPWFSFFFGEIDFAGRLTEKSRLRRAWPRSHRR